MRLADQVILHGLDLPRRIATLSPERQSRIRQSMALVCSNLSDAAVIHIDSVASYVYAKADQHVSFFDYCPAFRAPFDACWMEWKAPVELASTYIEKLGAAILTHRVGDKLDVSILPVAGIIGQDKPIYVGIIISASTDLKGNHNNSVRIIDVISTLVDPLDASSAREAVEGHAAHWGQPVLMALAFLTCKNIALVQEPRTPKLEKRYLERHGKPRLRFSTLNIEPMRRVLNTEGKADTQGLQKALHICRGHFAHYTEAKPLFGRVSGTFWVPQHTKGSADAGTLVKDYKVKV